MRLAPGSPHPQLRVDLIAEGDGLWVTAASGTASSVGACWRHPLDLLAALRCAARLRGVIERANLAGEVDGSALRELERLGGLLFDDLLPAELKAHLRAAAGGVLTIGVTPGLASLPLELLHDGRGFLALGWSFGRQLLLEGWGVRPSARPESARARLLIVADPDGSLPECYNEGVVLRRLLERCEHADVAFHSTRVGRDLVREELRDFDLVHVAGHVESDGLRLADGRFDGEDVARLAGGRPMPRLVVLNGCAAGDGAALQAGGLARQLLEAGVDHVIGPLYEVPDGLARDLAIALWGELGRGVPIGEALRRARCALAGEAGEGGALWAAYALFGNPEAVYSLGAPPLGLDDDPEVPVWVDRELALERRVPREVLRVRSSAAALLAEAALQQPRWWLQALSMASVGLLIALVVVLSAQLFTPASPEPSRGRVVSEPAAIAAVGARPLAMSLLPPAGAEPGLRLAFELDEPAFVELYRVSDERLERVWPLGAEDGWLDAGRHVLPSDGSWPWASLGREESALIVRRAAPRSDPEGLLAYADELLGLWPASLGVTHAEIVDLFEALLAHEGGSVDRITYAPE